SLIIPMIWTSVKRLFRIRLLLQKVEQTLHQNEGSFGGQVTSYAALASTMMADIVAIQNLYGAPDSSSATSGNTTWGGQGSTLGNYIDDAFDRIAGGTGGGNATSSRMAFTIYDREGTDLLDLSYSTTDDRIDLRPQQFSDVGGYIGNIGIARGTIIENLNTGSGDDTVTGNDAANVIRTNIGNDTVYGGGGHDDIDGGAGFDTIYGGVGADNIMGGNHADSIYGGANNDRLIGGQGFDNLYGGSGDDVLFGGETVDRLYGGADNDTLYGDAGDDRFFGGSGNDTLYGGSGNDTI
ncbi:calcium-binding protein, partial [Halovulum sp. GXIMD14793]